MRCFYAVAAAPGLARSASTGPILTSAAKARTTAQHRLARPAEHRGAASAEVFVQPGKGIDAHSVAAALKMPQAPAEPLAVFSRCVEDQHRAVYAAGLIPDEGDVVVWAGRRRRW